MGNIKEITQSDIIQLILIIKEWIINSAYKDTYNKSIINLLNEIMAKLMTFQISENHFKLLKNIFKQKTHTVKYIVKIFKKIFSLFTDIIWIPYCKRFKKWEYYKE